MRKLGAGHTYNANDELTTDQYDADGNTVGSGLNTGTCGYAYNFENRLVQQAGISIVYDGDGNRVSKATANVTTQYLVDDLNPTGYAQVIDEVQSSAVTRTYTWGLDLINKHQTLKLQTQIGHELAPMDRVKVAGGCARSCSPWFFSASRSKTRSRRRSAKPCGYRCDSES